MKLIIFDMDQTLVDFVQLHNEVTHRMLKKFLGVEAWLTEVDHAGRSQRDGLRNLAELKGVPAHVFEAKIHQILDEFGTEFAASLPADARNNILPGVENLLDILSHTDNMLMLYTGDTPEVIEAVFRATGLGQYFAYRFSGTRVKKREEMVTLAIEKAEAASKHRFSGKEVIIIGDSVRDVECGLKFNAMIIGVATGYYTASQLREAGADLAVNSLEDRQTILEAIGKPAA